MGVTKPGFSLEIAWAGSLKFDPLNIAAKGSVQYATEWWKTVYSVTGALSPPTLVKAFDNAKARVTVGGSWLEECTGPLTAMLKWVLQAGWTPQSATGFLDHNGEALQILHGAPRLIGKMLSDAIRAQQLNATVSESLDRCQYTGSADVIRKLGLWLGRCERLRGPKSEVQYRCTLREPFGLVRSTRMRN